MSPPFYSFELLVGSSLASDATAVEAAMGAAEYAAAKISAVADFLCLVISTELETVKTAGFAASEWLHGGL